MKCEVYQKNGDEWEMDKITGEVIYIEETDEWEFQINDGSYSQEMFLEEVDRILTSKGFGHLKDGDKITLSVERMTK
ncbi:hypothetical protein [Paenibacillus donghaensis]|uniref:Uncharacterized protein n=1 Tax=Paenibacillus donghaensis TaxID=414771 RepID=A0A2Z2KAJ9_9BACL|nr:hypothetical protein [Paenibacillus donghaensis]ASA22634.1 hypothetical protein B9T62_18680 [Paenibacillus donghaensis]